VVAPRECPAYLDSRYIKEHYPKFPDYTEKCTRKNRLTIDWINNDKNIKTVILAAAWSGHVLMLYTDNEPNNKINAASNNRSAKTGAKLSEPAFRELLVKLKDKKVLLLSEIPRPNKLLNECALSEISNLLREKCDDSDYRVLDANKVSDFHHESNIVLKKMADEFSNVDVIFPFDGLCDTDNCPTYINGELIYKDSHHIRRNLSAETVKIISTKIGLHNYFSLLSEK